jgi:hypothetical protein
MTRILIAFTVATALGAQAPARGVQPARDGQWQHADADWSKVLNGHLPR